MSRLVTVIGVLINLRRKDFFQEFCNGRQNTQPHTLVSDTKFSEY